MEFEEGLDLPCHPIHLLKWPVSLTELISILWRSVVIPDLSWKFATYIYLSAHWGNDIQSVGMLLNGQGKERHTGRVGM